MTATRYENPAAFQFLWLLPVVFFLAVYLAKAHLARLNKHLGAKLSPFLIANVSSVKRKIKLALELSVLALFIVALARPQSGESRQKAKSEGVEIMLLVDVSQSMLTEDAKPSRLELTKKELMRFLDQAGGDKVGLVAFAGSAVTLSPLTGDKTAMKMFIESLSPIAVSTQGTDFGKALRAAKQAFERGGVDTGEEGAVGRVVIVASDGEDNEKGAIDAAKELAKGGVRIFTLAVGTEKGGMIPIRDEAGNLKDYLKDKSGQPVLSRTKGDSLQAIAKEGKGSFHHMTFGGEAVSGLIADLNQLQKSEFEAAEITNYNEDFQPYLALALLLGLIELALGERKKAGRIWKGRFEVAAQ